MLQELWSNPFFYIPFITWIAAQLIKFGIHVLKGDFDLKYLIASGGMPSAHAAVVVSLAATAFLREGAGSPLFGALLVIAAIVVYDSFGVRRIAGEQSILLNRLIRELTDRHEVGDGYHNLREWLGHKPIEVAAGSILGAFIAVVFLTENIGRYFTFGFLFEVPASFPLLSLFVTFFGGAVVLAILVKGWVVTQKLKSVKKKLFNRVFWWLLAGGVVGLFYTWSTYEEIPIVSFPIIFALVMVGWLFWGLTIYRYYTSDYRDHLSKMKEDERKAKWL